MKYDNLARSLSMIEDEFKRANERVKIAEERVKIIEQDLESIGENTGLSLDERSHVT